MSKEHKEALARGRREAKAIKSYLGALGTRKPGRPVTPESLRSKIANLEKKVGAETDSLRKVALAQAKIDAEKAFASAQAAADLNELEQRFIEAVSPYSERKGITYSAWREVGVPAAVLRRASIPRTRKG